MPRVLSRSERLLAVVIGLTMVTLLIVASRLRPDPSGMETHRQLGLPPCTFKWIFGRPCPSCGMTTSWAHFTHGEWRQAAHANVGGTALALVSLIVGPWLLVCAGLKRWWLVEPTDRGIALVALVVGGLTLADWWRRW